MRILHEITKTKSHTIDCITLCYYLFSIYYYICFLYIPFTFGIFVFLFSVYIIQGVEKDGFFNNVAFALLLIQILVHNSK